MTKRIANSALALLWLLLLTFNVGDQTLVGSANTGFDSHVVETSESSGSAPLIYILVNSSIYGYVKFYVDRYVSDVKNLGFNATVLSFSGGSDEDVKGILVNAYSKGLVGCLLIGDIPWAYYEMSNPDPWGDEVFPIDLFYMDLDGVWIDSNGNGKYDQHTGNRTPEIWVGRIKASGMAESEVSLIRNYFDKNHAYRTGVLSLPNRALIYIDDDHEFYADEVDSTVSLAFSDRTLVKDKATTEPADYLSRLTQNWSLVHLVVHGEPGWHQFKINDEWDGYVTSSDIRLTDPHVFFYILVSCSNARYDKADYLGGWYIFSHTYGLAAAGTTKIGGMWLLTDFYSNLRHETLGYSFREWLTRQVANEDANPLVWYDKKWYYGMTILGDPTLSLTTSGGSSTLSVYSSPSGVTFSVDGVSHTTPWSGTYAEGASVGVMMPETYNISEATYHWSQWSDGVKSRSRTVTMNKDVTLKGIFELAVHDVAVTNVTTSESVVKKGNLVIINTMVENQGDYTETFNVTTYAAATIIQTETITLTAENSTTLTSTWNTSSFAEGDYTISAYASQLLGETDTTDNTFIDGIITISVSTHDVAISDIACQKAVVGQGYSVRINVTVENQGIVTETFNVTIHANATLIETSELTLSKGNSTIIAFTWNSTGFVKGNYTIKAVVYVVPGETDTDDNTYVNGWVIVSMIGDVTGPDGWPDGVCDMRDLSLCASIFGSYPGHLRWNPVADINADEKVDMKDVSIVAKNFGKTA